MTRCSSSCLRVVAIVIVAGTGACGIETAPLEGFDVVITPSEDCTLTGATSRDCVDAEVLAQQRTLGRWIFEHTPDSTFTLTTEEGTTLPGIVFYEDPNILDEPPCGDGGGLCYFARRRFESTDTRDNDCTSFGEIVVILRRGDDGTFAGIRSDTQGTDAQCGTSTVVQRRDAVTGALRAEPVQPRADALAAAGSDQEGT